MGTSTMTRPRRFLIRMVLFLMAVAGAAAMLFPPLREAFMANAALNGLILGVFLLGVINNFRQVGLLYPEVAWIESFRQTERVSARVVTPRLLAPMATMLGDRRDRLSLSALAMRSLLDGIASRLDESRDLSRYTIGLLIFLGLLGTFWGLMETVSSIRGVIAGLSVSGSEMTEVFDGLKRGLEAPLRGMGTAFSSSLFGLTGSLVLGFLDLQAGQAQNRFFNELEEWLSSITRLGSASPLSEGEQSIPAYVQALLEQTAESLENLQRTMTRSEDHRGAANSTLVALAEKIGTLNDHMRTEQNLMLRLAETQMEMKPVLIRLAESVSSFGAGGLAPSPLGGSGLDDATRGHIRNLDVYVARLLEELTTGREDMIQQVRAEIKLLARTLAVVAEGSRPRS